MAMKSNRKGHNHAPKRRKAKTGGYPKGGTKGAVRARKAIGTGKA
ncbi:MAG: hypothetical protein ACOYJ6_07455 [Caulobacterales bacterium]|jgi:hypothetical protein